MLHYLKTHIRTIFALLSIVGAAALLLSSPAILTPIQIKTAALALVTIGFWATGIIPEHITSLLFFLLAMLFSIASPEVIFSGFSSAAVWLVFGGLVIGVAIMSTGLGRRIADWIAIRLHGSYLRIISGLVITGVLFSFLMPSAMGRVVLLTPIAIAIADHFGFKEGTKGRTGVLLAIILGTFIPAFGILPANVPNMILIGMAETQYHVTLLYGPYLFLHFPVLSFVKAVLIVGLILWLYPDKPVERNKQDIGRHAPMTRNETILAIALVVMLLLWMLDFLHHISPAWIALGGAVFLLFPGINIVEKKQFNQKINWASIFFIAGILGLGGMINSSGLGQTLAAKIIALLPIGEGRDFINFVSISFASALTGIATTLPGVPAVFTPLSETLAKTTGLPIKTVLMMQVIGFSTTIFPYQAPPIVIGMQLSGEKFSSAAKLCAILAAITALFLLPINYFWWKLLGWL
ncbi:MAG TPA: SLC13 family permease [Desulfobulbus sp.]|nr:SLC13 family permease [Desulfobulbus sp.]